jgi:hypothetical protein
MRCKWHDYCPLREFEKQGLISDKWRKQYCEGNYTKCKRYQMTEKGEPHPDNMMPDGTIEAKIH